MKQIENLKDFNELIEAWQGELGNYLDILKQQYPDAIEPLNRVEKAISKLPYSVDVTITTDFYDNN